MLSNVGMVLRNIYSKKALGDYKVGCAAAVSSLNPVYPANIPFNPVDIKVKWNSRLEVSVAAHCISCLLHANVAPCGLNQCVLS